MTRRVLYRIIGVLLLIMLFPLAVSATGKHALLIGIQNYHSTTSLKGPENDVNITAQVLRERFGFQDDEFIILKNEQATHTGIERAFTQLTERVQENDFVYIYYSGHGSQTKDLNGDESPAHGGDGLDETWLSYGARSTEGTDIDNYDVNNYDVLDDEVDAWLAAVYAVTHNVVFVSDSCHSATVSRGQSAVSRAVAKDDREHPLGRQAYARPAENVGIRVGAARDPESAIEVPIYFKAEDTEAYYGLFTWHWVQALQQAKAGTSWNDVFKRASTYVTAGRSNVQQPQLWGQRGLQFDGKIFIPLKATIPITDVDEVEVTLDAGMLSGVTVGSVYRSDDASNPAKLTITAVTPFESVGKADGTLKKGDLVIEDTHAYHFTPIKVHVAADFPEQEDAPLLRILREALQSSTDTEKPDFPGYALASQSEQADLHLYVLRPKQDKGQYVYDLESQDTLPQSFPEQPPEVWVLTPEHRLLYKNLTISFADPPRGMARLQENLNKFARLRDLKTLESPGTMPQIELDVYQLTREECEGQPDCVQLPGGKGWHRKGEPFPFQNLGGDSDTLPFNARFSFILRNTSDRGYYCYLLDIMPDGAVSAVFPNPYSMMDTALVKAGGSRDFEQTDWFITNQPGQETLKFIVANQPIDVSLLESAAFRNGEAVPERGPSNPLNPLERLLQHTLSGQRGTEHGQPDEWAAWQVGFEVKE